MLRNDDASLIGNDHRRKSQHVERLGWFHALFLPRETPRVHLTFRLWEQIAVA